MLKTRSPISSFVFLNGDSLVLSGSGDKSSLCASRGCVRSACALVAWLLSPRAILHPVGSSVRGACDVVRFHAISTNFSTRIYKGTSALGKPCANAPLIWTWAPILVRVSRAKKVVYSLVPALNLNWTIIGQRMLPGRQWGRCSDHFRKPSEFPPSPRPV
ncbi:hypothetical protein BOTBODRAFT_358337 [Botryobasidium botryosum FD-172 SS1]|uniref:Uncharacterized protein n=1 Tax=Botryobasidium botryosum (strain FD-172 SS1) TaxID=930990 RepID=A0A067MQ69_BOTB1|nr:hypothetical protein BOTBODRAFT_358337 [Botryobasidium botryosum FD-172 SS1]